MQKTQETNYRLMSAAVKPVFDLFTDNSISHPQRVPETGPGIIVANHRCDIDAFYIMANIRRPVNWIGASYLWNIPLLPVLLDAVGGIPISRFQSEARAAVDAARASANADVVVARERQRSARARLDVGRAAVSQARESERIIRDRYDVGLAAVNDVLRASSLVLEAETARIGAVVDALVADAQFDRATGRDPLVSRR